MAVNTSLLMHQEDVSLVTAVLESQHLPNSHVNSSHRSSSQDDEMQRIDDANAGASLPHEKKNVDVDHHHH
jgi:hypothetical protein